MLFGKVVLSVAGRDGPSERSAGSVVTGEVDEPGVRVGAFGLGVPGPDVGPFFEQGAVETFDFAVGRGRYGLVFFTFEPAAAESPCQIRER